ncbi:MAG: caspase family protein [Planctomycetota bacterium]
MFTLRTLTLAGCLLAVIASQAATRHALVVGVNGCPDFRVGGFMAVRPLRGAEYDARQFANALTGSWGFDGERVTLLCGAKATHAAVSEAMQRLVDQAAADDTVVFYYAGHGTQTPDVAPFDEPMGERLDEALCLADANERGENLLIDDEIAAWIDQVKAAQVSVVLDCCHSGTGVKGSDDQPIERGITLPAVAARPTAVSDARDWKELGRTRKAGGKRLVALYACDSGQSAYERRFARPAGQPMGQFTRHLLEVMAEPSVADTDEDGQLSVAEAADYVRSQLDDGFNASRPEARQQTPHFEAARETWPLLTPAN